MTTAEIHALSPETIFFHSKWKWPGNVVAFDRSDGAAMYFEECDEFGDVLSGKIHMTEAGPLELCTEEHWNDSVLSGRLQASDDCVSWFHANNPQPPTITGS